MESFKDFYRTKEITDIIEENSFYLESALGSLDYPLTSFMTRLASNIRAQAQSGLAYLSPIVWNSIKSIIDYVASRVTSKDFDSILKQIPDEDRAKDEDVKKAFEVLKKDNSGISFEEMRMYMSILNQIIKINVLVKKVDSSAYYNALKSLIENPARFMNLNRPKGSWSDKLRPVANALSNSSPIQKAADLIAKSVSGKPEEEVVVQALKKTLEEMSDLEIRSIVWADRRFKKGREDVSKTLAPYDIDQSDLSVELERRPELRSRFRQARRQKSKFRKSK